MPEGFGLEEYWTVRPFLFHTLLRVNLPALQASRFLLSAAELRSLAGEAAESQVRRESRIRLQLPFGSVDVQDQSPLHAGNVDFQDGWALQQLVAELDARVFFWAADARGPVDQGLRHFERYQDEAVVLRVPFRELYARAEPKPEFCKFNSGSPRCVGGRRSPRGPSTFVPYARASFSAREVVEVTFRGNVQLPPSTQLADRPAGPWKQIWEPGTLAGAG